MCSSLLKVLSTCIVLVAAAPVAQFGGRHQEHQHHKRQDWSAIDWSKVNYDFSGVDWSTVNYDLNNVDWNTVFQAPAAAAATPVAAQTEQVVVNNNAVQAVPAVAAMATSTPVAASNVQAAAAVVNTPAVVATTVTSTGSSGKRGLGWDPSSIVSSAAKYAGSQVSWYFNWSPTPSAGMPSNFEFYANIWGSGGIENLANVLTGFPKLIGFNEPDSATQSNIDVSRAISLYQQYLVPLKSSGKISQLGTPAVTNSVNAGEGLSYLSNFVNGCTNCQLDFAVVHWYAESLDDFKNHVTQAHQMTGLPVNVAEFAYTAWNAAKEPSADEVQNFMTQAIAWLDAQSFVSAYAWFGSMYVSEAKYPSLGSANSLITEDLNSLTALGSAYCY